LGGWLGPLSARPKARGTFGIGTPGLLTPAYTYPLKPGIPSPGGPFTPPSPHRSARQCRNVDRLAIGIGLRLSLRARLPLIRLALIRKPGPIGGRVSRPPCRYSYLHLPFRPLHPGSRPRFYAGRNAPLPLVQIQIQSFGGTLDARSLSTHGRSTSELLRTL
jgi:hypothetical protein